MPELRRTVLVAEDDPNQVILIKLAFEHAGAFVEVAAVSDGDEAIAYLEGQGAFADRSKYPYPALVLVDLKMPRVSGFEVLAWVKQNPAHAGLPVIMLTSSQELKDMQQAYALGATSFVVKPVNLQDLRLLMQEARVQLKVVQPPPNPPNQPGNQDDRV